jgi:hypothetical protein
VAVVPVEFVILHLSLWLVTRLLLWVLAVLTLTS